MYVVILWEPAGFAAGGTITITVIFLIYVFHHYLHMLRSVLILFSDVPRWQGRANNDDRHWTSRTR